MRIYHLPLFSCAFINTACVCRQPILQANISVSVSHLNHDAIVEITIGISNLFNECFYALTAGLRCVDNDVANVFQLTAVNRLLGRLHYETPLLGKEIISC